jgi:putative transposase
MSIASFYRTRWEIELMLKELKSKHALHAFNTRNPYILEAMIWCALLTFFCEQTPLRSVKEYEHRMG